MREIGFSGGFSRIVHDTSIFWILTCWFTLSLIILLPRAAPSHASGTPFPAGGTKHLYARAVEETTYMDQTYAGNNQRKIFPRLSLVESSRV